MMTEVHAHFNICMLGLIACVYHCRGWSMNLDSGARSLGSQIDRGQECQRMLTTKALGVFKSRWPPKGNLEYIVQLSPWAHAVLADHSGLYIASWLLEPWGLSEHISQADCWGLKAPWHMQLPTTALKLFSAYVTRCSLGLPDPLAHTAHDVH